MLRLDNVDARAVLEEYTGAKYEIERHTTVISLSTFYERISSFYDTAMPCCGPCGRVKIKPEFIFCSKCNNHMNCQP